MTTKADPYVPPPPEKGGTPRTAKNAGFSPAGGEGGQAGAENAPASPDGGGTAFLEEVAAVLRQREGIHGDPATGLRASGKAITGLIEYHYGIRLDHDLPPHLVAAIQLIFKIMRNAGDELNTDNYTDMVGYAVLARRVDERRKP